MSDRMFRTCNNVLLGVVSLITIFPIYYVVIVSFTDPDEFIRRDIVWFPIQWSLDSYKYLLATTAFPRALSVSAFLAICGTACSLLISSALAYALSRKRMPGRKVILLFLLFTILFSPGIIPNYILIQQLGLINNIWSVILVALTNGWFIILMKGFFESIPESLDEAAAIDGCNDISTWIRIILPLSIPAQAAFGLFYAVSYWNQYFNALLYLNEPRKWPIQVLLQNMLVEASGANLAQDISMQPPPTETLKMAAVVIAIIPIISVYPFLQKHFAKGVMVGSIKE